MGERMRRWLEHMAEINEQTYGVGGTHCTLGHMDPLGSSHTYFVKGCPDILEDQIAAGFLPFDPGGFVPTKD